MSLSTQLVQGEGTYFLQESTLSCHWPPGSHCWRQSSCSFCPVLHQRPTPPIPPQGYDSGKLITAGQSCWWQNAQPRPSLWESPPPPAPTHRASRPAAYSLLAPSKLLWMNEAQSTKGLFVVVVSAFQTPQVWVCPGTLVASYSVPEIAAEKGQRNLLWKWVTHMAV